MKKMKKLFRHTLFDIAAGPVILFEFGIPALAIIIIVAVLVVVAVKLIRRAKRKNEQKLSAEPAQENKPIKPAE